MTFTPIGLQASDIAALIATDSRSARAAARPHPARHPSGTLPRHLAHLRAGTPKTTGGGDPRRPGRGPRPTPAWPAYWTGCPTGRPRYRRAARRWHRRHLRRLPPPQPPVLDWKFVGAAAIGDYKANGPGPQYRTQVHLTASRSRSPAATSTASASRSSPAPGCPPASTCGPRDLDEQVCDDALRRWDAIVQVADTLGPAAAPHVRRRPLRLVPLLRPRRHRPATSCAATNPRPSPGP